MSKEIRGAARGGVALLLLGTLTVSGCYRVVPLASPEPEPGTRITARLTDEGSTAMAVWLGPGVASVEGIVGATRPDEWELHMLSVQQQNGAETFWNREPVRFPRTALTGVQQRELDRRRSYLAAAGITAGLILAGVAFGMGGFFDLGGGGEDPVN